MRLKFRLLCLRKALSKDPLKNNEFLKNARRHLLQATFLCWTIYDADGSKYGLTHITLFPGGRNKNSIEYFDAESTKIHYFRNKFISFGRASLA